MTAHLLRRCVKLVPDRVTRVLATLYPPFLGAGIRVKAISKDKRLIRVKLVKSWFNCNYVGTQFGGSIFAMTDPFYMIMLIENLGPDYIVWDQGAAIQFLKPGKTDLHATFRLEQELLNTIQERTRDGSKHVVDIPIEVHDAQGSVVAKVTKTIYIRRRSFLRP